MGMPLVLRYWSGLRNGNDSGRVRDRSVLAPELIASSRCNYYSDSSILFAWDLFSGSALMFRMVKGRAIAWSLLVLLARVLHRVVVVLFLLIACQVGVRFSLVVLGNRWEFQNQNWG